MLWGYFKNFNCVSPKTLESLKAPPDAVVLLRTHAVRLICLNTSTNVLTKTGVTQFAAFTVGDINNPWELNRCRLRSSPSSPSVGAQVPN